MVFIKKEKSKKVSGIHTSYMPQHGQREFKNKKPEPVIKEEVKKIEKEDPPILKAMPSLPRYDFFKAPINLFDWDEAGLLFKNDTNGFKDLERKQLFADLSENYEVNSFQIYNGLVYFLFKLK